MAGYLGQDTFRLGFGLMRLPKLDNGGIDIEQTKQMVDMFMEAGGTYFDTAYVYNNGGSETAARKALVERYPRESFTLASKLCAWLQCHDEESAKQQFYTTLERTGAGYIDYYLLHAIQRNNYEKYDRYHLWDFVKELKEKGLVKHWGFSFHADPELLDELLTKHPDTEFVQLQINYADWNDPDEAAGECWRVARKHNKPIVIMEPVKGGSLADPVPEVKKLFKEADPGASMASWAIRYAASLEGIITVLSGMSNVDQMADNLSYMRDFRPLSAAEQDIIRKAQAVLVEDHSIKCTACHYCTDGCPMGIAIPEIFAVKNREMYDGSDDGGRRAYELATEGKGKASDCIACGACEAACPQQLPVISLLEECRSLE
ncbi:MAG: aldo/keto reductase [Lachnospiraceae bacterium]|nr:aldo/keto reductase [Lachnospiraceae bacterium]